jgi:hypothetical protein
LPLSAAKCSGVRNICGRQANMTHGSSIYANHVAPTHAVGGMDARPFADHLFGQVHMAIVTCDM